MRRALASADSPSGRDERGREQTDNDGEERAKTEAPKGHGLEGGRQLQGRRATERGGDERKQGRLHSTHAALRVASWDATPAEMNRFRCSAANAMTGHKGRLAAGGP